MTDLAHFLTDDGLLVPGPPGKVGGWFVRVAAAASLHPCEETIPTAVPCRRRPGRRPCAGRIDLIRHADGAIEWACSACDDNGFISGWEGTLWDWRPALPARPAADLLDLLLTEDEFAQIRRSIDLSPDGQMLVDGAVRVGAGVRMRGPRARFGELVSDLSREVRAARGQRRRLLRAIGERMGEMVRVEG